MQTTTTPGPDRQRRLWPWVTLVLCVLAGLLIWRQPWQRAQTSLGGPPGGAETAQTVSVAAVAKGDIPIVLSALGTVTSLASVTIKSQISGYLTQVLFREGQMVRQGDLLAVVDPRSYEVALAQYEGQLQKDQALLQNAQLDLARYRRLNTQDSISRQTVDTAAAAVAQDEGTVRTDQAQVDAQKLNLAYCHITAPVAGRVGLRQVDSGNYVTASDTDGIVVVTQLQPISVVFTLPEDRLPQVMKRLRAGGHLTAAAYDRTNTEKLADGMLETVDNQIDTTTGTVKLRAVFDNADEALFPNQFVNVRLLVNTLQNVVIAPSTAIQTGTPGTFVYLVTGENTVAVRKVKAGAAAEGHVAILSGLAVGDRVVVDGADRLHEGAKVTIADAHADTAMTDGTAPR